MYNTKDPHYEPLYAAATFLAPLQSNDLTETEKKLAREYLKEETKKLEDYDQAVVWRLMGTSLGLRRCRRRLSTFLALVARASLTIGTCGDSTRKEN